MDWDTLLDSQRLCSETFTEDPNRPTYLQDADRITFSAPFRRLANKTQVHPLYEHDHLHHRMIHSVETASVGRSLGIETGSWLEREKGLAEGERHRIAGIVQTACLAHDIGNPPFGHSGEAAIGSWFRRKFRDNSPLFQSVPRSARLAFEAFEGNAQGFRLLTRLEMYRNRGGMRLSHSVLAAFAKYPATALAREQALGSLPGNAPLENNLPEPPAPPYCGLKKFGLFDSEADLFADVATAVGLPATPDAASPGLTWWRRHPLVFLVEAADDICYNIVDLEDAWISGDLSYQTVMEHLEPLAQRENSSSPPPPVPPRPSSSRTREERIAHIRAISIGTSIAACVEAFRNNYDAIMAGTFSGSLIAASSRADEFRKIRTLATEHLFPSRRKTELEIFGRNVIFQVLDGLSGVCEDLAANDWTADRLQDYHQQLCRATGLDLRDVRDSVTALHALTDYVSGMTDRYAVKIARMLAGA